MTSTPTLCQVCGREQFIDKPRQPDTSALDDAAEAYSTYKPSEQLEQLNRVAHDQYVGFKADANWGHARALKEMGNDKPDTSARDAAAEILGYHGCSSGDCPHEKQSECFAALVEAGYDAGHARALKEMGAEVERVTSERDGWHEDLLVASKQVADMEEQLAAAQNVIDELELNESKMNGALSAKQEQLAACELRAGEYEKALENIPSQDGISWSIARKVLKAHRRGGES